MQHVVDITGRKGPVNKGRGRRIEAVIVGLGVVRPVALGDPGLDRHTGARGDTARAAGESDLEIMIGGGIGRTHRDYRTGNITTTDGCIVTIEGLRFSAVFRVEITHRDR